MVEVQLLQLLQKPSDKQRYRFLYEVVKDNKVIAARYSNRHYVACFVGHSIASDGSSCYEICQRFSRINLIGKGNSKGVHPFGVAVLATHQKKLIGESILNNMAYADRFNPDKINPDIVYLK